MESECFTCKKKHTCQNCVLTNTSDAIFHCEDKEPVVDCAVESNTYRLLTYDTTGWSCSYSNPITDLQETIRELEDKLNARAVATFHCNFCGTENFTYTGTDHTPHCPNCGALMIKEIYA